MYAIDSELAPAAIGTYSQAICCGDTVYLSGQIGLDPKSMQLCLEIRDQINQIFNNLAAVCSKAGGSLSDIVKLSIYLIDLNHFALINEAMTQYFSPPYPARVVIGAAALPRGAQVEMDGIMILRNVKELL